MLPTKHSFSFHPEEKQQKLQSFLRHQLFYSAPDRRIAFKTLNIINQRREIAINPALKLTTQQNLLQVNVTKLTRRYRLYKDRRFKGPFTCNLCVRVFFDLCRPVFQNANTNVMFSVVSICWFTGGLPCDT